MKVLVLGGNGMAGRAISSYLHYHTDHEVVVTVRNILDEEGGPHAALLSSPTRNEKVLALDVRDLHAVAAIIGKVNPDVVINAVGILNQQAEENPLDAYMVNGLLPHWLRHLGRNVGPRLIHISSDCVFLGDRGRYTEGDEPDGISVYARSKALGEIRDTKCLTIRTSIIGPEIRTNGIGLMQWFLSQQGQVEGYVNVAWNGITTLELAKAVVWALEHPEAGGLIHLTAPHEISKHDLLLLMQETFDKRDVVVKPDNRLSVDRTLSRTKSGFGYQPPDYPLMLVQLRNWMAAEWP